MIPQKHRFQTRMEIICEDLETMGHENCVATTKDVFRIKVGFLIIRLRTQEFAPPPLCNSVVCHFCVVVLLS